MFIFPPLMLVLSGNCPTFPAKDHIDFDFSLQATWLKWMLACLLFWQWCKMLHLSSLLQHQGNLFVFVKPCDSPQSMHDVFYFMYLFIWPDFTKFQTQFEKAGTHNQSIDLILYHFYLFTGSFKNLVQYSAIYVSFSFLDFLKKLQNGLSVSI